MKNCLRKTLCAILIFFIVAFQIPLKYYKVYADTQHMVSNCGRAVDDELGDSTGQEYALLPWYNHNTGAWQCVLRHPKSSVAQTIAALAVQAAQNNHIGYSNDTNGSRFTFWEQLQANSYKPSEITEDCASDCSGTTECLVKATGYLLNIEELKDITIGTSSDIEKDFSSRGFQSLRESKYTGGPENLQPGDIIVNYAHSCIYVGDGSSSAGGTELSMKGTQIADCCSDGNLDDPNPGDQSGREYFVRDWYDYGWEMVYRYPDENVAKTIAAIAISAANNEQIGYNNYGQRDSLNDYLETVNYDFTRITSPTATNCSGSTACIVKAAGYKLNIEALKQIPNHTWSDGADYPGRGFQVLTDSKYLRSCDELLAGDLIRVQSGSGLGHITIFVGNGESSLNGLGVDYPIDDIVVNLDEQNFEFAGVPKTVSYSGRKKDGEWIFSLFSQFIDFVVGIITNGLKISIMGWAMTFESAIDSSIKFLEGL